MRRRTRDQLTVHVLLPHCGLSMRMISPDVTRAGLHGQRGRRSLAATAVAKNSAADPSGHHLVTKLHLHAGGALPARHETTVAARNRLIGRRVMQLHGHERGSVEVSTQGSSCAMSFVRWSRLVRISLLNRIGRFKIDETVSNELLYGLRFFALAAKSAGCRLTSARVTEL